MTQMSELTSPSSAPPARNAARSFARAALAHRVQVAAFVLAVAGLAPGCVIPPSLQVGAEDAAVNSPPAILSVSVDGQDLPPPGPVNFVVADTPTMTVDVLDTDLGDTLYVRAFVDYCPTNELDARSKCVAPPSATNPTAERSATCDLRSLCVASDVTTKPACDSTELAGHHDLTIVVFDREPLDNGTPAFQAMPPGGLSTSVYYHMQCMN